MNIEDYTPTMILAQARAIPNPLLTLVFNNEVESTEFYTNFLKNSQLTLSITKSSEDFYRLSLIFPKHNNHTLFFEPPKSENPTYEEMFGRNISVTCGFQLKDGKIVGLPPYILDNKITLN